MNTFRLYVNLLIGFIGVSAVTICAGCEKPQGPYEDTNAARLRVENELKKANEVEAAGGTVLNVGFVVLESVYNSELMAPYDVFQHTIFRDDTNYMQPFMVSPTDAPIVTFEGIEVLPHFTFNDSPAIDILVLPSTEHSMSLDLENAEFMDWLKKAVDDAAFVVTVCDGAFPLAATGALDGRTATTFPGDREEFATMFPEIEVLFDKNFVVDGKFITSVGGALSYEPALYLVEHLYSKSNADKIAEGLVWDWDLEQAPHLIVNRD